jgi:hypothetical protein
METRGLGALLDACERRLAVYEARIEAARSAGAHSEAEALMRRVVELRRGIEPLRQRFLELTLN